MVDPLSLALIGGGVSLATSLMGYSERDKAMAAAKKAVNAMPTYQIPEEATNRLAQSQAMLNAANPEVDKLYGEMARGAATQAANAERNAASGVQALGVAAAADERLKQTLPQVAQMQTAYKQQNLQNYYAALDRMAEEKRTKYMSELQKQQLLLDAQLGQAGAGSAMLSQGVTGLASILSNPGLYSGLGSKTPGATESSGVGAKSAALAGTALGALQSKPTLPAGAQTDGALTAAYLQAKKRKPFGVLAPELEPGFQYQDLFNFQ